MKGNLEQAFLHRLRLNDIFPKPERAERRIIWEKDFRTGSPN
jgi:hypothetical protein